MRRQHEAGRVATGVFSSRQLERATYDSVAFRYVAANRHPDHDSIAHFRKRFLTELSALFVQILQVAQQTGVLKVGQVSLDGTKVHANASRHSALSWEYACKIEAQLKAEVEKLLRLAEEADGSKLPDGMSVPEELERREERLAAIARAKAAIEARAAERHAREQAAYEEKMAERAAKEKHRGKKPGGPTPLAQRMSAPPTVADDANAVERMKHRLRTTEGRQVYAQRKCTVEPTFGIIKSVLGFRQFLLRGLQAVQHAWTLVCIGWNVKRLHRLHLAA